MVKTGRTKDFKVGEKVMAVWQNHKKYPAKITKVLDGGNKSLSLNHSKALVNIMPLVCRSL